MADEENRGASPEQREQRHESRTSQTFMRFVRDLKDMGRFESEEEAIRAAAVVLTALERRLTSDEARDLNAQLPLKLVELLRESNRPERGKLVEKIHHDQFIKAISQALNCDEAKGESAARSVFATVRALISEGEAGDVASQLPGDLIPLWSQPV